ncbi:MAG: F0F1 ATP synthase subunit alpha [Clostridiales bacterium]|jgi:F-type H+-transporting ATPase subunit alpha|nr:F0F1 ATP synthase subunit alpha [Clostridiales bacterium]
MSKIITIKSAYELDEVKKRKIINALNVKYGSDAAYSFVADKSVIGGIMIIDGERVYDATYISALAKIREILKDSGGADAESDLKELRGESPFGVKVKRKGKSGVEDSANKTDKNGLTKQSGAADGEKERDGIASFKDKIKEYAADYGAVNGGKIVSVSDGVIKVSGLNSCKYGELLRLSSDRLALAMNLETEHIGAVLLGDKDGANVGEIIYSTGNVVEIPVGEALLGRVVNPLGIPVDGKGGIHTGKRRRIEAPAPQIADRGAVDEPLETGILALDSMIPIGKGQRELIIGDRQTGKTAVAVDIILNQKDKNVLCVYVAIGQKASSVAKTVGDLEEYGALSYTTVVVAGAKDSAPLQYIAPFSGCAMAEEFMYAGRDALIVYDDLSKHAVAYRTLSLLLKRPSGREAYPGDIFYLHSRLLERAAKLSPEKGGGSITALPIIETLAGDISAYIPTNVISITDGQIFLESQLFNSGIRPAVNVGLSVSRVGGSAQIKAMRQVSGRLRLDLAHYRELEVFSQFGSDVDQVTREVLNHGKRTTEALKQAQYFHMSMDRQVIYLYAVISGHIKAVEPRGVSKFLEGLYKYIESVKPEVIEKIKTTGILTKDATDIIDEAARQYASYYETLK